PGGRGAGAAPALLCALERARHGDAHQPGELGAGGPHRQLCLGGDSVRSRLQPFLSRTVRAARWGPGVPSRALVARVLCARIPRGAHLRGSAAQIPAIGRSRRPVILSASLADAGLLAVLDSIDGPGGDPVDLSGSL